MAIKEIKINRFDRGIAQDRRDLSEGLFYYMENFDVGNYNNSVTQVVNTTSLENTQFITKLLEYNGSTYGLGFDTPSNQDIAIYKYDGTPTFAYSKLSDGTVSGTTFSALNPFFAVMDDILYLNGTTNYMGTYALSSGVMTPSWKSTSVVMKGGTAWQGNLYGWADSNRNIYKITSTSVTSMIVIPNDQDIKEIVAFGNYLAIICTASSKSDDGVSRMYLWDGVTTTTFAEIVDIGFGDVAGGDIMDGTIYAVIGFPNRKGFRIKAYTSGQFSTTFTYYGKKNEIANYLTARPASVVKAYTGNLYFMLLCRRPGSSVNADEMVLMRYGKRNAGEVNKLCVYKSFNFTPTGSVDVLNNDFVIIEDNLYPFSTDLNVRAVIQEDTRVTRQLESITTTGSRVEDYSGQPGAIETGIYTLGDPTVEKQLRAVSVHFAPLPTGATVVLKYKKDEDSSWTEIFTETTANKIAHPTTVIESTGLNLPSFREIQFRVEVTGKVELTGLKFKYEELSQENY